MPDGIDDDSVDENTEDVFDLDLRRMKESDPWVKELCARGSYDCIRCRLGAAWQR